MFEKSISFILAMVMTVSLGTSRFTSTDTNQDVEHLDLLQPILIKMS